MSRVAMTRVSFGFYRWRAVSVRRASAEADSQRERQKEKQVLRQRPRQRGLLAFVGSLQVLVGGVGLRLIAARGEDLLVHVDGVRTLMEQVVHLAGA